MTFESRHFIETELWFREMVDALSNRTPDSQQRELMACLNFKIFEMYKESASNPLRDRSLFTGGECHYIWGSLLFELHFGGGLF